MNEADTRPLLFDCYVTDLQEASASFPHSRFKITTVKQGEQWQIFPEIDTMHLMIIIVVIYETMMFNVLHIQNAFNKIIYIYTHIDHATIMLEYNHII